MCALACWGPSCSVVTEDVKYGFHGVLHGWLWKGHSLGSYHDMTAHSALSHNTALKDLLKCTHGRPEQAPHCSCFGVVITVSICV